MVVDFTTSLCRPCKLMKPVIEEFATTFRDVDFVKIDVDELMAEGPLNDRCGNNHGSVPQRLYDKLLLPTKMN
ncbi:thioredoxin 1 [Vigna unguiculata]|uniref:Thioredoxin 1 n=1 Tax=Vigna unguiculata TaxID=3917 RepID=A0A4D6L4A4_VIGUN|nr:thioredoxin 1 [Vigna unguiculata]